MQALILEDVRTFQPRVVPSRSGRTTRGSCKWARSGFLAPICIFTTGLPITAVARWTGLYPGERIHHLIEASGSGAVFD